MAETCVITGKLVGANGVPIEGATVSAQPTTSGNLAQFSASNEGIARRAVATPTNHDGEFALAVVRGIQVILTIEAIGYNRVITVPNLSTVNFRSL